MWSSPSNPSVCGIEALIRPLVPKNVASSLRALDLARFTFGSFLLLPLAQTDRSGLEEALRSAKRASATLRISLSIDEETLKRVDTQVLVTDQVGLVLDGLSLATSMATILSDVIEGARFDPSFIAEARRSVRVDAALRTLLSLTRSLGLATFGSTLPANSSNAFEYPFDYVTEVQTGLQTTSAAGSHSAAMTQISHARL